MKRFRVKVVELGLALAAGSAVAADWHAPGQPAAPVTAGAPGLLPSALRAPGVKPDPAPIWLPAREPAAAPVIISASGRSDLDTLVPPNAPAPQQPQSVWSPEPPVAPVGPRFDGDANVALPVIPVVEIPVLSEPPVAPPIAPAPRQPDPVPPKPAAPAPPMPAPRAPDILPEGKRDPLPMPRPVETPQPELPCAPPELMIPVSVMEVGTRGTFGSPSIRISRDYPTPHDLVHQHRDITLADDGPANRVFVRGEYLLWWMPGFPTPVLATTNPNTALNGYFGEPGTTSILGPGAFLDSTRSGFRVRAGAWIDEGRSCGIDAGFFFLGKQSNTEARGSAQFPLITRPIFAPNTQPGTDAVIGEFGEAVAVPGILQGTLTAQGDSQLWGADVNLRKCLFTRCDSRAELFVGYRHLNLRESLTITENITVIGPGDGRLAVNDPLGTRVVVQDRFATRNTFNGGQIGAAYERRVGRWDVDARGSVALGSTHQVLSIDGFQTRSFPNGTVMNFRGGLLAAGPNIGRFERDKFSVAPEFTLNVGYNVTPSLRVFAGYNFLLWTNVIRPGDQIDRVVDLTFVPNAPAATFSGQPRPRAPFTQRDLVVNGVQFGLDWRW